MNDQKKIKLENLILFVSCFPSGLDFEKIEITEKYELDGDFFVTVNYDSRHFDEERYQSLRKRG